MEIVAKHKNLKKNICIIIGIYCSVMFGAVLIRSVISGITYDEAYTYIKFGHIKLNFDTIKFYYSKENCIANNHWLNTILINIIQQVFNIDYNEFMIRLPTILSFLLYIIGAWYGYIKGLYPLPLIIVLVSNYMLLEFYGLARGYGMSNTFLFFTCIAYLLWKETDYNDFRHINWMMLYASIALFCITSVLLVFPAFGILVFFRIVRRNNIGSFVRRSGLFFLLFMLVSMIMFVYHMNISSEGKPLFTGSGGFFLDIIVGFHSTFFSNIFIAKVVSILVSVSFIFLLMLFVRYKKLGEMDFTLMLLIFLFTNIVSEIVFKKGNITGRALLSFYSFVIISLYEMVYEIWKLTVSYKALSLGLKSLGVIVCILLTFTCMKHIDVHSTNAWNGSYKYKDLVIGEYLTGEPYQEDENWDASELFYQQKYNDIKEKYLLESN